MAKKKGKAHAKKRRPIQRSPKRMRAKSPRSKRVVQTPSRQLRRPAPYPARTKEKVKTRGKKAVRQQVRVLHRKRKSVHRKRDVHEAKRVPKTTKVTPLSPAQKGRLRYALELVRKHVHGFDAASGYNMRDLASLSHARRKTLVKKAAQLKELLNAPHDLVSARTKKGRRALVQFTRQKIRRAKHFIVHKPADNFSVRLRANRVVVKGKFRNRVITESEFFLFPRAARSADDVVEMAKALLEDMPKGFYVLLTGAHGDTGEPFDRDSLLRQLQGYLASYQTVTSSVFDVNGKFLFKEQKDQGFAQSIVGFRRMSTTLRGAEIQREAIDTRRENTRKHNERLKRERRTEYEASQTARTEASETVKAARRRSALKGAATRRKNLRLKKARKGK